MSYTPLSSLDDVSSVLYQQQDGRASLASSALSRGATRLTKQDFEGAAAEFRRAAAYAPDSVDAYRYLGHTYALMGRSADAIAAYEKAVKADPNSTDARSDLAKTYMTSGRYDEAEEQFRQLERADRTDAGPVASLGYIYMQTGRLDEAEDEFELAARLAPRDAAAQYSLGLVNNRQGRYEAAIGRFENAIALKRDYPAAYADLAYAYIGLDDLDGARSTVDHLWEMGTGESQTYASELELVMYTPKIAYAEVSEGTFNPTLDAGSPLYMLDSSLTTPGASKNFTMVFQFNQAMDLVSVQNAFNWSILQAQGGDAGVYNSGSTLAPDKQAYIMPFPVSVKYDPVTYKATVTFKVSQNATGDAVIDPEHWVFRFRGMDASGNPIDPRGDEYDGYARSPF